MYNSYNGEHHYTLHEQERDGLISAGWTDEGIGFYASQSSDGVPVYRLYFSHTKIGSHYYTTSLEERDALIALGWTDQGIGLYVAASGDARCDREAASSIPVRRLYKTDSLHCFLYTTNRQKINELIKEGSWADGGIAWYAPFESRSAFSEFYKNGRYHCYNDNNDRYNWVNQGYTYQGIDFYSDNERTVEVYRLANERTGFEFLTASKRERDAMLNAGWTAQGVACYAIAPGDELDWDWRALGSPTSIEVLESGFVYDGTEKAPSVKVGSLWGSSLSSNSNWGYDISYTNNVNAGIATVRVTSKDNVSDSIEATFEIAPRPLDGATVVVSDRVYTGEAVCPEPTVLLEGKELAAGVDYTVSYADNVEPGTATVTVTGTGNYTGSASKSFNISVAALPQYRLYNPWSGEHFYTSNADERANVLAAGWVDEGEGWKAPQKSDTPVFRMYNPYAGEHHYCMDAAERDNLIDVGWEYEGIGWYSDDEQRVPLYRDYNPNEPANNHNYTTDKAEHDYLVSLGWVDEGYAWYGMQ